VPLPAWMYAYSLYDSVEARNSSLQLTLRSARDQSSGECLDFPVRETPRIRHELIDTNKVVPPNRPLCRTAHLLPQRKGEIHPRLFRCRPGHHDRPHNPRPSKRSDTDTEAVTPRAIFSKSTLVRDARKR
jgi:hypothetical protein